MSNYYILKIDSSIDTFSQIEVGINFKYETTSYSPKVNFEKDDFILGYKSPSTFYVLKVLDFNNNELNIIKQLEITKNHFISFDGVNTIKSINEDEYKKLLYDILSEYKTDIIHESGRNLDPIILKEAFAEWFFNLGKYKRVYSGDKDILLEKLNEYEIAYKNDFDISIFDYPNNSLETIIEALETNLIDVTGNIGDINRRTVGNGSVKAILGPKNYIKFLKESIFKNKIKSAHSPQIDPINKIYFGAPGTGKSFQITEDLKDVDLIFQKRVTFHPEYDNASFIGGYKPITDNNGDIKYEFVPQIFTNIYVEACNDHEHQYYLIIEEINRGNCAEIFGELFQLLDRDKNYKITPSNELIDHLNNEISKSEYYIEGKMLLPDNLSIYATMNTSDQSLFPMDSAFKRRWDWEYIPINYSRDATKNKSANYNIVIDSSRKVNWIDFINKINSKIEENSNLGMDKCIGNYFVKPNEFNEISLDNFIHKVMFYLWNDVFKDEPKDSIFTDKISYQSFFPIKTEGLKQIIIILENLDLLKPKEATEETQSVG